MTNSELKTKLTKLVDYLKTDLAQVRTGRATPSIIESITVDAYDTKMSLLELGSISVLDPQNLVIVTWDKSVKPNIIKAIRESGLGLNPVEDGERLRVPIPALTEERRKEFTKLVASKTEETKTSMRGIRQDAMKDVDKLFSDKAIGEDDKFRLKEEVEKLVKDFVTQAEVLCETKQAELLTI